MAIKRMAREWTRARAMPFERARAARERAGTPGVRRARWSRARARRASSRSSPQPTAAAHAPHCWTSDQKLATPSLSRAMRARSSGCHRHRHRRACRADDAQQRDDAERHPSHRVMWLANSLKASAQRGVRCRVSRPQKGREAFYPATGFSHSAGLAEAPIWTYKWRGTVVAALAR